MPQLPIPPEPNDDSNTYAQRAKRKLISQDLELAILKLANLEREEDELRRKIEALRKSGDSR